MAWIIYWARTKGGHQGIVTTDHLPHAVSDEDHLGELARSGAASPSRRTGSSSKATALYAKDPAHTGRGASTWWPGRARPAAFASLLAKTCALLLILARPAPSAGIWEVAGCAHRTRHRDHLVLLRQPTPCSWSLLSWISASASISRWKTRQIDSRTVNDQQRRSSARRSRTTAGLRLREGACAPSSNALTRWPLCSADGSMRPPTGTLAWDYMHAAKGAGRGRGPPGWRRRRLPSAGPYRAPLETNASRHGQGGSARGTIAGLIRADGAWIRPAVPRRV